MMNNLVLTKLENQFLVEIDDKHSWIEVYCLLGEMPAEKHQDIINQIDKQIADGQESKELMCRLKKYYETVIKTNTETD